MKPIRSNDPQTTYRPLADRGVPTPPGAAGGGAPFGRQRTGAGVFRAGEAVVGFGGAMDNPYSIPLDTGRKALEFYPINKLVFGLPSGTCKLCSNYQRYAIDCSLFSGAQPGAIATQYGWSLDEVLLHMAMHSGPIYARAGRRLFQTKELFHAEVPAEAVPTIHKAQAFIGKIDRTLRRANRRSHGIVNGEADLPYLLAANDGSDWKDARYAYDGGFPAQRRVLVSGMRNVSDGESRIINNSLVPWSKDRMRAERDKVTGEAINFYDEMLDIRNRARRVYDEVLDSGEVKHYGIANGALTQMRGVVDSLAKMSLIAKRFADETEGGMQRLSPEIQGIVDQLAPRKVAQKDEREKDELRQTAEAKDGTAQTKDGVIQASDGEAEVQERFGRAQAEVEKEIDELEKIMDEEAGFASAVNVTDTDTEAFVDDFYDGDTGEVII